MNKMNDYNVKKKLFLLYVCCVLLPLFITDSVIMTILLQGERTEKEHEMANIASAVQADLVYTVDEAVKMTKGIYISWSTNEFLDRQFRSGLDFWEASRDFTSATYFSNSLISNSINIVLISDNRTIINGGHFYRLASIRDEEWYQRLEETGLDTMLHFYYIGDSNPTASVKRRISLVQRLNYYKNRGSEKLARIDIDYSTMVRKLINMKYSVPVYVCRDNQILYSNVGYSGTSQDFEYLTGNEKIGYIRRFKLYGEDLRVLVMETKNPIFSRMKQHFPLIALMIAVNIILPMILMSSINRSFTTRLRSLSQAFDEVEAESLKEISDIQGKDEIGSLMRNYNRMVQRSRELIKTIYKDKMERQEIDLARKSAELLALHSQINPHFLFNVLESIRMHSILKKEAETATMIERLALLERQNVDWTSDFVKIQDEIQFIEAYLELQKYRFGDRLSYKIDVKPDCAEVYLPKLTLVTFVENACVHGVEKKAVPCWIYVRAYQKDGWLYLEVEDTGEGMEEQAVTDMIEKMRSCNIETLMNNEHVGMINACLRLKMVTDGKAEFELESETGVGTFMLIKVPINALNCL